MTNTVVGYSSGLADRFEEIRRTMAREYAKKHSDPWIVAYSGGKDSTLLLQLVWETLLTVTPDERHRDVHVIANDTLVESPVVIEHLKGSIQEIGQAAANAGFPIRTWISRPYIDQTFWVNIIGRGYIPPTRNFRWCTDRMKIQPTNRLLEEILSRHKRAVLLVGTRRSESQTRRRNMTRHGVSADKMNPHSSVKGCRMFAPLADLEDNEVWMILMQRRPPWGGSHRKLITIYRNAGGGECPLVLSKDDAPSCGSTSPRFGCWTCTVVKKDRSMNGTIESGHAEQGKLEALLEFREELIRLREDSENRSPVRRDGLTKRRADGTQVYGPFKLEVRQQILDRLRALEAQTGEPMISQPELEVIEDIWRRDRNREESRLSLVKRLDGV